MNRIAVCPGSFDPVTYGHIDIVTRSAAMFDEVVIVVMNNYLKKNMNSFTVDERLDFLRRCTKDLSNVKVDIYSGLLADYVKKINACAIVKGLRAVSDYENEFQQALTNMRLAPEVETIFLITRAENMFLSSSVVKQVCMYGGDITAFVPDVIRDDVVKRLLEINSQT